MAVARDRRNCRLQFTVVRLHGYADSLRQRGDGRRLEQFSQRQIDLEPLGNLRNGHDGHQGMAAQLEKIVVDADTVKIEYRRP